jgi:uncharacterized protein YqjF (DUF2071 family)
MKLDARTMLEAAHRPWPSPVRAWLMTQTWHNLLFAHVAVQPERLALHVPEPLEIDTFDGRAYLGVVAFRLSGIRLRGLPAVGPVSHFNEINLRTYVKVAGKPGVLFLSMDADNAPAIRLARPWFRLPYTYAAMSFGRGRDGYSIASRRRAGREGSVEATFKATYGPSSPVYAAEGGTLEHWLTERYCYYSPARGRLYRCEIAHERWPLQRAWARIEADTLASALNIEPEPGAPLLHYAHRLTALIWSLERVGGITGRGRARPPARGAMKIEPIAES